VAAVGADGTLTAPADFLAVWLAMYSGLAMTTELTAAKQAEKVRTSAVKILMAAEQNNAMITAADAFKSATACMSEVSPRIVDVAQAAVDVCSDKTEQKTSPARNCTEPSAVPTRRFRRLAER
jgi:hypothetical protein